MESLRECTLRGQLELVPSNNPIDIDQVEPASEIVKRFVTGNQFNGYNPSVSFMFLVLLSRCHEFRKYIHRGTHHHGGGHEPRRS